MPEMIIMCVRARAFVCLYVCVSALARVSVLCVRACVRACVRECVLRVRVRVCMSACARALCVDDCDEMRASVDLCKRSGLLRDGA